MTILYAPGDGIEGETVACQYRSVRIKPQAKATHTHRSVDWCFAMLTA